MSSSPFAWAGAGAAARCVGKVRRLGRPPVTAGGIAPDPAAPCPDLGLYGGSSSFGDGLEAGDGDGDGGSGRIGSGAAARVDGGRCGQRRSPSRWVAGGRRVNGAWLCSARVVQVTVMAAVGFVCAGLRYVVAARSVLFVIVTALAPPWWRSQGDVLCLLPHRGGASGCVGSFRWRFC